MNAALPFKASPLYEEGLEIHSLALYAAEHLAALRALAGSAADGCLKNEEWMFLLAPLERQLRLLTALVERDAHQAVLIVRKT